jgi:hypothetical protein
MATEISTMRGVFQVMADILLIQGHGRRGSVAAVT